MNTAVIVAAGRGVRMGGKVSKQYMRLGGVPILGRTLSIFTHSGLFDQVVLVVAPGERDFCSRTVLDPMTPCPAVCVVDGGDERQESVAKGLAAIDGQEDDVVLIHDGVRPFVSGEAIAACLSAARDTGAAIAAVPACDTLKEVGRDGIITGTLPRETVWLAQTPQGFHLGLIREAHRRAREEGFVGTDDAQLVERLGRAVTIVPGSRLNVKITTPDDLLLADAIRRLDALTP